MTDNSKTRAQLLDELAGLRQKVADLEAANDQQARAQTLAALRESEQNFRDLVENSPDGVIIADKEGCHLFANRRAAEITGYSVDELLNITLREMTPPEKLDEYTKRYQERVKGEPVPKQYERPIVRKDGATVRVELTTSTTIWQGQVCGMATIRDITERSRAEEALQSREHYFRSLMHSMHEGILVIDRDYRIADLNNAVLLTTGFKRQEMIGQHCFEISHGYNAPCDQFGEQCALREVFETGQARQCQHQHRQADGSTVHVDILLSPLADAQGDTTHVIEAVRDVTEHVRAAATLRNSQARLQSIFRAAPVGIGLVSNRMIVQANDRLCEMLGYSRDELLGKNARMLYPSDEDYEFVGREKYAQISQRGTGTVETLLQRKGGAIIDVLLSSTPLDPDDLVAGVTFTALDITEWKRAEAQRDATLEALRHRVDLEKLIATISTNFVRLAPDELDSAINEALRLIGGHAGVDRCYLFTFSRDGRSMHNTHEWCAQGIEPQIEHLQDLPAATFPWWMERLKRLESLYIPRVADLPPEARVEKEILQAQSIQSLIVLPVVYGASLTGFLGFDSVQKEKSWEREDRLLLKTVGELLGNALERERAERALQESHSRLEETLAQLQEAQEKLVSQERLAAVGQLSAGVAHEFNTILATLSLYTQMSLHAPDLPPKIDERLGVIDGQIGRAADLVQQVLDFGGRTVLRREVLDLSPLVTETVAALERTLPGDIQVELQGGVRPSGQSQQTRVDGPQASPSGRVRTRADGAQELLVRADAGRVRQAIVNLALNARDAMTLSSSAERPSGGTLRVTLSRVAGGEEIHCVHCGPVVGEVESWVRIDVSDTGVGIPPDVLPHIFEPFFTTRLPLGSGLGLAQVYGIVKQHGGHIAVETELGRGTTLTLYWPALPAPDTDAEAPTEGAPDLALGDGETILVVEDDDAMRAALVDALEVLNYHALAAADGQEALRILETPPPSGGMAPGGGQGGRIALVLSDWAMPGMSGLELARELERTRADAKVLILTGYTLEQQVKDSAPAAVVRWLQKPPDLDELAQAVALALAA